MIWPKFIPKHNLNLNFDPMLSVSITLTQNNFVQYVKIIRFGETYHEEIPLLSKTRVFLLNISWFGMSVVFLVLSVEGESINHSINQSIVNILYQQVDINQM